MKHAKLFSAVSLSLMLASTNAQNVGIETPDPDSTLSIQNKLEIGGAQGDVVFTDDEGSILFPATGAPNSPMIYLFGSGTANADRMVLGHSPSSPTWGLQYTDVGDKFQFLGAGLNAMTVDLSLRRVGVGTASPATLFHVFSSTTQTMRFEGPNNFFDFYSTNPAQSTGMRFYNSGSFEGGMFYQPLEERVYFGPSASLSNSIVLMDLSGARKLALVTNAVSADHDVAIGGNVHIQDGAEAGLTTHGYLQTGATNTINLVMDNNEITARSNGLESPLFLQPNQGNVVVGSTSDWDATFHVAGNSGESAFRVQAQGSTEFLIDSVGAIIINSVSNKKDEYELNVDGQIVAEEVLVQNSTNWPDYVFEEAYSLRQISDIEAYIAEHKHLPDVPSAAQIEEDGILLGEMDKTLLRKIEELTLYVIQQSKDIAQLKQENTALKAAVSKIAE